VKFGSGENNKTMKTFVKVKLIVTVHKMGTNYGKTNSYRSPID
jgi:hypothetical protein